MDTKIRISQAAQHPMAEVGTPEQYFYATLESDGVDLYVDDRPFPFTPWGRVEDVEYLADKFCDLKVWEFRVVIGLLVRAKAAQHLVEVAE
jgi:hypothetical protein